MKLSGVMSKEMFRQLHIEADPDWWNTAGFIIEQCVPINTVGQPEEYWVTVQMCSTEHGEWSFSTHSANGVVVFLCHEPYTGITRKSELYDVKYNSKTNIFHSIGGIA